MDSENPGITIVIPSYNRPRTAQRAVRSAIESMGPQDELILVDDGSDLSYLDIEELINSTPGCRYLRIDNQGVSHARNTGINHARCPIISFLDDDDEWLPGHLLTHRRVFRQHPDLVAVFSDFYNGTDTLIPGGIQRWTQHKPDLRDRLTPHRLPASGTPYFTGDLYSDQLAADHILPSALSINTEKLSELRFETGLHRNQSWLFSSQCCARGEIAFVDESLVKQHPGHHSRATAISEDDTVLSRLYVMTQVWGRDRDFQRHYRQIYEFWLFNDFYILFRSSLANARVSRVPALLKSVGATTFIRFSLLAIWQIVRRKKPIWRRA